MKLEIQELSLPLAILAVILFCIFIIGMLAIKKFFNSIDVTSDEEKEEEYQYRHWEED